MITLQEMFDRAYIGLRSQGFKKSTNSDGDVCAYTSEIGHCAWGWVDPNIPAKYEGVAVDCLTCGVAATLSPELKKKALDLQVCHDSAYDAEDMRRRLVNFAAKNSLTVPE